MRNLPDVVTTGALERVIEKQTFSENSDNYLAVVDKLVQKGDEEAHACLQDELNRRLNLEYSDDRERVEVSQ